MRPKSIHTDSDETAFSARVRVFSRQASRIAEHRFRILKCDAVLGEVRSRLRWTPTCAHARNMYVHMHAVKRCSELCGSSVLLANRWTFFRYITALCSAISAKPCAATVDPSLQRPARSRGATSAGSALFETVASTRRRPSFCTVARCRPIVGFRSGAWHQAPTVFQSPIASKNSRGLTTAMPRQSSIGKCFWLPVTK